MSHSVKTFSGHWQMHRPSLEAFVARVNSTKLADIPRDGERPGDKPYEVDNGVAKIEVVGIITDYPSDPWFDEYFGLCPAMCVIENLEKAEADPEVVSLCIEDGLRSDKDAMAKAKSITVIDTEFGYDIYAEGKDLIAIIEVINVNSK